ncbi:MAG: biopolymer transporter ExbD [Elusimicrobia bacterium]|nr:biopolymer transporter ExbD [Elusimicrobiota bacterium]
MARKYGLLRLRASLPEPEPVTEVNVIPVIDISLVLLVILFISAPLLSYPNLPIELPSAMVPQSQENFVAITYTAKGQLALASELIDWPALVPGLKKQLEKDKDTTVMLRVDKAVPYRMVAKLMAAAKEAGARKTALGIYTPK